MGPNFTPLHLPHVPSQTSPPSHRPKSRFDRKMLAIFSGIIVFTGVIAGYIAMQSGIFYRSRASTGFSPVDRRPYENCYQPFMTYLNGTSITINTATNCQTMPPISIDVWKMSKTTFDDQTLVLHKEFIVKPGSNTLSIPLTSYTCSDYYQIDTWLGSGAPPSDDANYGYALLTATFVKPAGSTSCGAIPAQYCSSGATISGPTSCAVTPTKPPPTATPKPTNTPIPSPTPTRVPVCASSCSSDSQCPVGLKCYNSSVGTYTSPTGKCVLAKCLVDGTVCTADKCTVIPPTPTPTLTSTPTPKPSTTPPPTATNACPKPNPVKNLRINCPLCKQS